MASAAASTSLPQHSQNADEELNRVQLALDAVFSPQPVNPHQQQQDQNSAHWWERRQLADRYLTSFQSTSVSWLVCDRLLLETVGTAAASSSSGGVATTPQQAAQLQQRRFFAAQTLHKKCQTDADELPDSAMLSLRDSLLNHLTRYATVGDVALTNRLAMCVSALAVQMLWTSIVTDLLGSLSGGTSPASVMQVLKVLPEECSSDRLILVDENLRYQMRDQLVSTAGSVFKFLQTWNGNLDRVFEVFLSWIRHVPVETSVVTNTPLLEATVQALTSPQNLELATDVVIEVLRMYPSHHQANQPLIQKMIPLLSILPFDQALRSDDEDVLRAYCRIITEMGESYMSLILSTQHNEASKLVQWVLRCSGISEPEIAAITLHFWYRMVLDLEAVEPYDFRQELIDRFTPHLLQLIDICATSLMKYPPNVDTLSDDVIDDLNRDRFYVSETLEDCCRLLGGQVVVQRLAGLFRNECGRVESTVQSDWQGVESCLSCIQSINRFVASDEAELLPFCFDLIPRLPPTIQPLRFTASKVIGKYASWLAAHPQYLQPLLPFLSQGLSIPICAPAAAVAIKELCECSNQQMSMGEPVLQLYNELTLRPGTLNLKDELEVLEGVCRAISRQMRDVGAADGTSAGHVQRLVQPVGNRLAAAVADPNCNPRLHIIPEIDRLTVVIRFLHVPRSDPKSNHHQQQHQHQQHPILDIVASSWSLLDAASNRFAQDVELAEKICRFHKHALRACGPVAYAPMLDSLMEQLVQSYQRSHQAPFLYAASICVTEYGRDVAYSQKLYTMMEALAKTSFTFLRTLDDLTHHPDVVEELFYLMGRMISHCPDPLVTSPLLQPLFQCAIVGMKLDHRDANRGTLTFLENSISYGLSLREQVKPDCKAALEHVILQEGQAIVTNLALSLMGQLPAYNIDSGHGSIAGILWKINLLSHSHVAQWMSTALRGCSTSNGAGDNNNNNNIAATTATNHHSNTSPASIVPEHARGEFLTVLDSGLPRDNFNLAVRSFQGACERHRKKYKIQQRY